MAQDGRVGESGSDVLDTAPPVTSFLHVTLLVATLVGVWAVLQLSGLWDIPFHSKGEPREAVVVQDLIGAERYLLPLRNGYEMPRKPPMFYWLGGIAAALTGSIDEGITRLPSAVQSLCAAVLLLALAVVAGRPAIGLLSALVLLTSFEWMRSAVSARIDMTLALGTTASFAGFFLSRYRPGRIALCLLYGGMIWGTLAKGPIGIVLPTLCIVATLLIESGTRWIAPLLVIALSALVAGWLGVPSLAVALIAGSVVCAIVAYAAIDRVRSLRPLLGYAAVLVATALWYGLAMNSAGEEFFRTQILAENFGRFLGSAEIEVGHRHGPGYLVGALFAGLLPWTLFLPAFLIDLTRPEPRALRILLNQAVVWIVVVFAFFTASSSKRSVYLLPLYPAASLLVGAWLARMYAARDSGWQLGIGMRALAMFVIVVGGTIAAAFAIQIAGWPLREAIVDPIVTASAGAEYASAIAAGFAARAGFIACGAAAATISALALYFFAAQQNSRGIVAALFVTVLALQVLVQRGVMPAVTPAASRIAFAARLEAIAGERPIIVPPSFDYGLAFYLGGAMPVIDVTGEPPAGAITVISRENWRQMSGAERARYEVIAGLDAAKQGNQASLLSIQRVDSGQPSEAEN